MSQFTLSSMREGFARGVKRAAAEDAHVVLLGCDVTRSLFLHDFAAEFPTQYVSVGIAEQNAASIAAGLALCGDKPIFATYAAFATTRTLDQIRMSICYNHVPVLIAGAHAGLSVGPDGGSHQALEDIAVMRTLPAMQVVLPADVNQTEAAVHFYLRRLDTPVYIRFGRNDVPNFTAPQQEFRPGAEVVYQGTSGCVLLAHGAMVWNAMRAAEQLHASGIYPTVVAVKTLGDGLADPLIRDLAQEAALLVTIEEHQIQGGLGGYIAELLGETPLRPAQRLIRLGVRGAFGMSGTPEQLYDYYGLTPAKIAERVNAEIDAHIPTLINLDE